MDELLKPISSTYLKSNRLLESSLIHISSETQDRATSRPEKRMTVTSADEAVDIIKSQPTYGELVDVLEFLSGEGPERYAIQDPSPKNAVAVHLLVNEIVPNYWILLYEETGNRYDSKEGVSRSHDSALLVKCLQGISGLHSILAHIRGFIQDSRASLAETQRPDVSINLEVLVDVLAAILGGSDTVRSMWTTCAATLGNPATKKTQRQILLSLLTGGRISSGAAEALSARGQTTHKRDSSSWIADGTEYNKWLGTNIARWVRSTSDEEEMRYCSDLFQRGLSLGYPGRITLAQLGLGQKLMRSRISS